MPLLALPRQTRRYLVDTEAFNKQMGYILLQEQRDGPVKPVGYWSRILNKAEQANDTTHRAFLAFVRAVLWFGLHLERSPFNVSMDHDSLHWIQTMMDNAANLACRWLQLSEFKSDVIYGVGVKHHTAEILPRLSTQKTTTRSLSITGSFSWFPTRLYQTINRPFWRFPVEKWLTDQNQLVLTRQTYSFWDGKLLKYWQSQLQACSRPTRTVASCRHSGSRTSSELYWLH